MNNAKVQYLALETIENILSCGQRVFKTDTNKFQIYVEYAGGRHILKEIQSSQTVSDEIYEKASGLIQDYFNEKEVEHNENKYDQDEDYQDEDDDLNVRNQRKSKVPDTYVCFKCKQVGNHWIMDCDKSNMKKQFSFGIPQNMTNDDEPYEF